MSDKNFENLKKDLFYTGFSESLYEALEANLRANKPEFTLTDSKELDQGEVNAVLHFKKSNDNCYFNSYDATYTNGEIERSQRFFINNLGPSVTLKEAGNMLTESSDPMLGRAIYKELAKKPEEGQKITSAEDIQTYRTWLQLDFSKQDENGQYTVNRYHDKYGFSLTKSLDALPLKELSDKSRDIVLSSMEKGSAPTATMNIDGNEVKVTLMADPANRAIVALDPSGQKIELKKEQKQSQSLSGKQEESKKKGLVTKNKQDNGLMKKNRQSTGKGQKVA